MVFIDTNIFLHAAGAQHPLREPCLKVLRRIAAGSLEATTNSEVIQEVLFVIDRRGRRKDALQLARDVCGMFPNLLPVTRADLLMSCDLLQRYPHITIRDSIHAASMLNNQIKEIVSADPDFDHIPGLRRIEPA